MSKDNDAYGHILCNLYKGLRSFSVVERDDGYVNVDESVNLYLAKYNSWDKHEKKAIKYIKSPLLDIGCGGGRILLYAKEHDIKFLGIDTSKLAIKICKARGTNNAKVLSINNIGKLKAQKFGSIVMFGRNFGLLENASKAKRLLNVMYNITAPNAIILADSRDPYITDNPVHFEYHEKNRKRGRMPGQLRLRVRFMQYSTQWHDYLYVSKDEMKELLNGTGWRVSKFINSEGFRRNGVYVAIIKKM